MYTLSRKVVEGVPLFNSARKFRLNEETKIRNEKCEMRNGGAAHKNMEAPQSIDGGDAMNWHLVTNHLRLLIPNP